MKTTLKSLVLLGIGLILFSCQQDEPTTPEDFGYLTIGISVQVESEPASGRVADVNTDNFKVTIFQADGTIYQVIDPYSSAPPEVQLPVGEYYVEATSNNLVEAAFDSPYYFARSDNFTIDKEELKTIDIEAKLANCKVTINFSSEVTSVFDAYSGQVEVVSSGTTLSYAQGETREGYFVVEPLAVEVYLSYTKLDGTTIDRTFNASIDDPQPATLYNINVDATLEDGQIVFNLTVDESVDTVNIDLGGSITGDPTLLGIKNYGGTSDDWYRSSVNTYDGGIVMVGISLSNDNDLNNNNGETDGWIVKVNRYGAIEWQKTLGGSREDEFNNVVATADGGYAVIGSSWSVDFDLQGIKPSNDFSGDYWLVKFDNNGNLEWQQIFGGRNGDRGYGIDQTFDGGFILTGNSISNDRDVTGNHGNTDMWAIRTDAYGYLQWQKSIGGSGNDFGRKVIETSDGNYLMIGNSESSDGDFSVNGGKMDAHAIKFNQTGIMWVRSFGGVENDYPNFIKEDANQTLLFAVSLGSEEINPDPRGGVDAWLIRMDMNGTVLEDQVFGGSGSDGIGDIEPYNGGYIIAGGSSSNDGDLSNNYGSNDFWLLLVNNDLNPTFSNSYGGTNIDGASKIHIIGNNLFLAGTSWSNNVDITNSIGNSDFVILNFDL